VSPKKITRQRPTAAKLRSWRVVLIRAKGEHLGTVAAPDRERAEAVPGLILKRASASRLSGEWNEDDFDVLADGAVVGRIFKANAAPVGSPWMWSLAFGYHEDRTRWRQEFGGGYCMRLSAGLLDDSLTVEHGQRGFGST
jgi:hypothetical protein